MDTYSYYLDYLKFSPYDFTDKEWCIKNYIIYMLNRTQRIFKYTGLPDTIPQRMFEYLLQVNGFACVTKVGGELYAFYGGLGGEPDVYYQPTVCVVSSPALKWNSTLKIGEDCVVVRGDSCMRGLIPLFNRYATAMVENDLSFKLATINTRIQAWVTAPDDTTAEAGNKYLEDVEAGELGVVASNEFLEGIKVQPVQGSIRTFTDLIEYQQYLKASWYNEIGLNANYNMKREKLSTTESQMNNDALLPLVDDMLEQRKIGVEEINKMFGTNITVEFDSSWEKLLREFESSQVDKDGEIDESGNDTGDSDAGRRNSEIDRGTGEFDDRSETRVSEEDGGENAESNVEDSGSEESREDTCDYGESDETEVSTPERDDDTESDVSVGVEVHVDVNDESTQLEKEVNNDDEKDDSNRSISEDTD